MAVIKYKKTSRGTVVLCKCDRCGGEFTIAGVKATMRLAMFCSSECRDEYQQEREKAPPCPMCGEPRDRRKNAHGISWNKTCGSEECARALQVAGFEEAKRKKSLEHILKLSTILHVPYFDNFNYDLSTPLVTPSMMYPWSYWEGGTNEHKHSHKGSNSFE